MKKDFIKPSILPGFMELLPKEQRIFSDIVSKIKKVYEENGCLEIDTPIIEKAEVLLKKSGGETEKQVYRFQKGKNDLALRFDLTVPFSRYVAQYREDLVFPFKRYQIGKVYRGERNQRGRYREFYQIDLDIIGKEKLSINNDAWVISLASKAFKEIGLEKYQFQISNRKILKGILEELNIEDEREVMILIDKYEKMEREEFYRNLYSLVGKEKSEILLACIEINGSYKEGLKELKSLDICNSMFLEGIEELEKVIYTLILLGVGEKEFRVNLKIIRGLDYYTSTVFETVLLGNENFGSICSGGRYDNLTQNYMNNKMPGVGISIGITRLFFILKEINFIENYFIKDSLEYLIIPIGENFKYAIEILNYLDKSNKKGSIYFEEGTLKKKLNYANKIGVGNVIIIGEDEEKKRNFKIKNMLTGEDKIESLNYNL